MIVLGVKVGRRVPALEFLKQTEVNDEPLYAKIEDLIERIWNELNPPPRLPRDAMESLGQGLWQLRARGASLWGRVGFVYGNDSCIVLLDGLYKKQNKLLPQELKYWRDLESQYRQGALTTVVLWRTKP